MIVCREKRRSELSDVDVDLLMASGMRMILTAFMPLKQVDGPPLAWHERTDGRKFVYQAFSWKSESLNRLLDRVRALAYSLEGKAIVWRERPALEPEDDGYAFYCRLYCLPYEVLPGEKPQGEPIPVI